MRFFESKKQIQKNFIFALDFVFFDSIIESQSKRKGADNRTKARATNRKRKGATNRTREKRTS